DSSLRRSKSGPCHAEPGRAGRSGRLAIALPGAEPSRTAAGAAGTRAALRPRTLPALAMATLLRPAGGSGRVGVATALRFGATPVLLLRAMGTRGPLGPAIPVLGFRAGIGRTIAMVPAGALRGAIIGPCNRVPARRRGGALMPASRCAASAALATTPTALAVTRRTARGLALGRVGFQRLARRQRQPCGILGEILRQRHRRQFAARQALDVAQRGLHVGRHEAH